MERVARIAPRKLRSPDDRKMKNRGAWRAPLPAPDVPSGRVTTGPANAMPGCRARLGVVTALVKLVVRKRRLSRTRYRWKIAKLRSSTQIESPKTLAHWIVTVCEVPFFSRSVMKLNPAVRSSGPSVAAKGDAASPGPD